MAAGAPPPLSPRTQLHGFLRFARAKRVQHVRECLRVVDDAVQRYAAAPGDVCTGQDVHDVLSELHQQLEAQVDEEVSIAYHGGALALQLLLSQANAAGAVMQLNTAALEDCSLLEAVRDAEAAALARPASEFPSSSGGPLPDLLLTGLGSGSWAAAVEAAAAASEKERGVLKAEVADLQARLQALQTATTAAMRDKTDLAKQLEAARSEAAAAHAEALAGGAAAATSQAAERHLSEAQSEARRALDVAEAAKSRATALAAQLEAATVKAAALEAAASERLQAAPQFRQLQALMKSKNEELAALRRRLAKYEPEEVASAEVAGGTAG